MDMNESDEEEEENDGDLDDNMEDEVYCLKLNILNVGNLGCLVA